MFVIKYRKIFYAISTVLIVASLYGIFAFGMKLGIDFTGGSNLEVAFQSAPDTEAIKGRVDTLGIGEYSLRQTGTNGVIIRSRDLSEPERQSLVTAVAGGDQSAVVKNFDSVGPILGEELRGKALMSIIFVIIAIVLFITFAFRHVSKPVASWKYGMVAIVALLHDIIVPAGAFAYLGHFHGVEIDALFVTALLVVLGFSVHDTIVVFDRIRENLLTRRSGEAFADIVNHSIVQTLPRSINTQLTSMFTLTALLLFGGTSIRNFVAILLIGLISGTFSSIFNAAQLLVVWENREWTRWFGRREPATAEA
jgi:preprotein translocase subunit SecF